MNFQCCLSLSLCWYFVNDSGSGKCHWFTQGKWHYHCMSQVRMPRLSWEDGGESRPTKFSHLRTLSELSGKGCLEWNGSQTYVRLLSQCSDAAAYAPWTFDVASQERRDSWSGGAIRGRWRSERYVKCSKKRGWHRCREIETEDKLSVHLMDSWHYYTLYHRLWVTHGLL